MRSLGNYYTVYLRRTKTVNMMAPYQTKCRNYTREYLDKMATEQFTMDLNVPLSREVSKLRNNSLTKCLVN